MTSHPSRTGSTATEPRRLDREKVLSILRDEYTDGRPVWEYYEAIEARILNLRAAASPSVTEPEAPADVERLISEWNQEVERLRASPIASPQSLLARIAGINWCISRLRAARPAEAQAAAGIDVERIIHERLADYRSCSKEDDCETRAEGIERALEDVEYERARLASLPTEPEADQE